MSKVDLQLVRFRFAISAISNTLKSLLGFITTLIIARALGAHLYGNFVFLVGFFCAYRSFSDLGTSRAFYYFITQRSRSAKFIAAYFLWLAVQCLIPVILIGFILPHSLINFVWVGLPKWLIVLAFLAIFLRDQAWQIIISLFESKRLTHKIQPINFGTAIVHLLAVLFLIWVHLFNLKILFGLIVVEYFIFMCFGLGLFIKDSYNKSFQAVIPEGFITAFKGYCVYCIPLIWFAVLTFFYSLADRWFLQHYSGSVAQAYYGIGAYFSNGCLIATTSILNVFIKEISEANYQKNIARMKHLYTKAMVFLFMLTAVLIGALVPWSKFIVAKILGPSYVAGYIAFAIMLLFPVHQTMDSICQSMYYATGDTKTVAFILSIFRIISIPVSFFVLATPTAFIPALHSGAVGLAIKMVVLNILTVNAMAWVIARKNNWRFMWEFQVFGFIFVLLIGFMFKFLIGLLDLPVLVQFGASLCCYLLFFGMVGFRYPMLFGLQQQEVNDIFRSFCFFLKKKN
ncbi:MAG: lipopolysaccharide biosynthesis protein [Gammaproteobacteria bacterium]